MNSKQILETNTLAKSEREWLKEIAYQLALLNEKTQIPNYEPKPLPKRVKPQ